MKGNFCTPFAGDWEPGNQHFWRCSIPPPQRVYERGSAPGLHYGWRPQRGLEGWRCVPGWQCTKQGWNPGGLSPGPTLLARCCVHLCTSVVRAQSAAFWFVKKGKKCHVFLLHVHLPFISNPRCTHLGQPWSVAPTHSYKGSTRGCLLSLTNLPLTSEG